MATREEAVAWQPEKVRAGPRWSIAFQIWLTAAAAVTLIAVGVLAWGVARGSGDDAARPPTSGVTGGSNAVPPLGTAPIRDMQLVNQSFGWALSDNGLFRTDDAGDTWRNVEPAGLSGQNIIGARFIDSATGWLVGTGTTDSEFKTQVIAYRTTDGGSNWQSSPLPQPGPVLGAADIDFLDKDTGWIVVNESNNDRGPLYRTTDGGVTWSFVAGSYGDQIYFANSQDGWTIGGIQDAGLFETQDGGETWHSPSLSRPSGPTNATYALPAASGDALLVAGILFPSGAYQLSRSSDGGQTWAVVAQADTSMANSNGFHFPDAVLPDGDYIAFFLSDKIAYRYHPGDTGFKTFPVTGLGYPQTVTFADDEHGWALSNLLGVNALKKTNDGGHTWSPLSLPAP